MMTEVTTFFQMHLRATVQDGMFRMLFLYASNTSKYSDVFTETWCVDDYCWNDFLSTYILNQQVKASDACYSDFLAPTYPREFWLGCSDYETHLHDRFQLIFVSPLIPCFGFVQSKAFNRYLWNILEFILAQIKEPQEGIHPSSLCQCCSHQAKEARVGPWMVFGWFLMAATAMMSATLGCPTFMAYCDCLIVFAKIGHVVIYCIHLHPDSMN